jgi:hypothetical protein
MKAHESVIRERNLQMVYKVMSSVETRFSNREFEKPKVNMKINTNFPEK